MFYVEVGKGSGSYKEKMRTENRAQAWAVYKGYNVGKGYKKRLVWRKGRTVTVLARVITRKWE